MAITTNNEYFLAALSRFNVSQTDIDVMLLEAGLDGSASVDVTACKNAIYRGFSMMLPLSNVSEGGYSVSWNMEAVKMYYNQLCKELGESNVLQSEIRNKTNLW
jgi:hypothetical protein